MSDDIFNWLENWFEQHCDGQWEYENSIVIETTEKPGWMVMIDVANTRASRKNFLPIQEERNHRDWIFCAVADDIFEATCGVHNLREVLGVFRNWIESFEDI